MSKLSDLTCKILNKLFFPTYSCFYLHLQHAVCATIPLFDKMVKVNHFRVHLCLLQLLLEFGPLVLLLHSFAF